MNISAKMRKPGGLYICQTGTIELNKPFIHQLMRVSVVVIIILLTTFQVLLATSSRGQNMHTDKVTINLEDESLSAALKKIEQQTALRFYYRKADIKMLTGLSLPLGTRTIEQTLRDLLKDTFFSFRQIDNSILVERMDLQTSYEIKGRIIDVNHKPIEFAMVNITKSSDKQVIQSAQTDTAGFFKLTVSEKGDYFIRIAQLGMDSLSIALTLSDRRLVQLPDITLSTATKQLQEVTITGKIPSIENKGDRYIVNVANSPMATSSSLQLLKLLPFVRITPEKVVKLENKNTMILVDNRPVPGVAIQDILDNLKVNEIDKIELITQPSAKYDSNYGAVINIITKKNHGLGFTGNVTADDSQGLYNSGSVSSTLTYKTKKLTVTGRASYGHTNELYIDDNNRIESSGPVIQKLQDSTKRLYKNNNYSIQLGADYKLTPNQNIGFLIYDRLNHTPGEFNASSKFRSNNLIPDSIIKTNSSFRNDGSTFNYNINYHLLTDSAKNDLSVLFTYTPYKLTLNQSAFPRLYDGLGNSVKDQSAYQTYGHSDVKIYIGQIDYLKKLPRNQIFETGAKFQNTDSHNIQSYNVTNNFNVNNISDYSTNTDLLENIVAAYGIYSKNWKRDNISLGLRVENTNTAGVPSSKNNYINYFPNAKWNHNYNNDYALSFSYGKFINRPPYQELLPYKVITDQFTIMQGNTDLKPSYDNTFTTNVKIKNINVSLEYTHTLAPFFQLPVNEDAANQITTFAFKNLKSANRYALNSYYSFDIAKWWNMGTSISTGYYSSSGEVLLNTFNVGSYYFTTTNNQTISFSKTVKLSVNAYYISASNIGLTKVNAYGNVDASAIFNISPKLSLTLSGEEILKRLRYHSESNYGLLNSQVFTSSDTQRIRVGLVYSFGKQQIKDVKKNLGNEDATKRL